MKTALKPANQGTQWGNTATFAGSTSSNFSYLIKDGNKNYLFTARYRKPSEKARNSANVTISVKLMPQSDGYIASYQVGQAAN